MITNNIITENVAVADVLKTIGTTATDAGTLCTHPNINMWSKYKPFKFKCDGFDKIDDFKNLIKILKWGLITKRNQNSSSNATSGAYTSLSRIATDARNGYLTTWEYEKPSGGENSPFRLGDFYNYFHNAVVPIRPANSNSVLKLNEADIQGSTSKNYSVDLGFYIVPEGPLTSQYLLKLSDLYGEQNLSLNMGDMYFGIMIYNNNDFYAATQPSKFNTISSWDTASVKLENLDNKSFSTNTNGSEWNVLPFFSFYPSNGTNHNGSGGGTSFIDSTKYVFSFAEYKQHIRGYNAAVDDSFYINNGGYAVMFTDNTTYNDNIYVQFSLTNNTKNAINNYVRLSITYEFNGSKTVEIYKIKHNVEANGHFESSNNLSQYPTGSQLFEIDLTKVMNIEISALRNSVINGTATFTIEWPYVDGSNSHASKTVAVINGYGGNPIDP